MRRRGRILSKKADELFPLDTGNRRDSRIHLLLTSAPYYRRASELDIAALNREGLVKRLIMLVTSDGQWVLPDNAEFLAALGDLRPDYDAASFAVKNLGFVKFQMLDDSIIEIEIHPRNVQLPALLAVQQQLLSSRVKLFRIKYLDQSWKSEITSSAEGAIARLSELCSPAFAPLSSQKYVVEPKDYSALLHNEDSQLRLMAQKWRMSFGCFDETIIPFAIKNQLLSRMVIAGINPRTPDPVFRFIGDGFLWMANDYQFYGIGQPIENLPDKDYGTWVARYYQSVASSGRPRYDLVTAAIEASPHNSTAYLTRYERLLLPWKTSSDEVFVSLCSRVLDDDV